ncbi:MFS transporter [Pseudoxanthomonas wuyuanensis]|uniref:Predicted arabinose efflux permease, MFS family n=1 Tax=Pseudoxanthomonas wuyuanensis TaxID=1073196 RepID=A0A286DBT9_9GAMM|nr:MFS transporter [Pseudoxanthomonas wuyuanensis]KAF1721679.1 MFS transporter [Pseudoxanthomonas wuyuanensis]SOD56134.1 Predicted arabinose efflux permease, MFS family [Pseudoxanthomonas wuyuanensis]
MSAGRTLFFIALGLFGLYAVEFGVVGILPAIIARYDISVAQAGWLVGLFALIVAAGGPFMVLWLSRLDRRKVLAGSLLVFSLCSLLSAWAPNFATLMALRVPSALLHPVFFAVAFAAAVSLYRPERAAHATAMAFVGTSMGLVLGVPLTTWVQARVSYEASFLFCAAVNLAAAIALWVMLPAAPKTKTASYGSQLAILRKPAVWLAVAMTVCVFGAMFSVYSYAAEYLARETGLNGEAISVLLVVFGVGGVLGNLLAGRWLGRNRTRTVLLYPVVLAAAYGVLLVFGSASLAVLLPVCLLWGAAHTSGLIVSQVWLTSAAPEAPEFATSLYISAANLGVVFGSTLGGAFITSAGMPAALWSGWLFTVLAVAFVILKIRLRATSI